MLFHVKRGRYSTFDLERKCAEGEVRVQLKQSLGTAYGLGFERGWRMETDVVLHEGGKKKKTGLHFGSKRQQANTWMEDLQKKMCHCV